MFLKITNTHGVEVGSVPWIRYLYRNKLFSVEDAPKWKHYLEVSGGIFPPLVYLLNPSPQFVGLEPGFEIPPGEDEDDYYYSPQEAWCKIEPDTTYSVSLWMAISKLPYGLYHIPGNELPPEDPNYYAGEQIEMFEEHDICVGLCTYVGPVTNSYDSFTYIGAGYDPHTYYHGAYPPDPQEHYDYSSPFSTTTWAYFTRADLKVGWNRLFTSFKSPPWASAVCLELSTVRGGHPWPVKFHGWMNNDIWITGVMCREVSDPDSAEWHQADCTDVILNRAHDNGAGWTLTDTEIIPNSDPPAEKKFWTLDLDEHTARTDAIVPEAYQDGDSPGCAWEGEPHRSISV
jgi:hypothetical protein